MPQNSPNTFHFKVVQKGDCSFLLQTKVSYCGLPQTFEKQESFNIKLKYDIFKWSGTVFLNRRDASRYRDLEAFLPGLELFWKL